MGHRSPKRTVIDPKKKKKKKNRVSSQELVQNDPRHTLWGEIRGTNLETKRTSR